MSQQSNDSPPIFSAAWFRNLLAFKAGGSLAVILTGAVGAILSTIPTPGQQRIATAKATYTPEKTAISATFQPEIQFVDSDQVPAGQMFVTVTDYAGQKRRLENIAESSQYYNTDQHEWQRATLVLPMDQMPNVKFNALENGQLTYDRALDHLVDLGAKPTSANGDGGNVYIRQSSTTHINTGIVSPGFFEEHRSYNPNGVREGGKTINSSITAQGPTTPPQKDTVVIYIPSAKTR